MKREYLGSKKKKKTYHPKCKEHLTFVTALYFIRYTRYLDSEPAILESFHPVIKVRAVQLEWAVTSRG